MSEQPDEAVPEWTLGWRLNRALAHAGIANARRADTVTPAFDFDDPPRP